MVLEACCHTCVWFVTLTYAPEHLPEDGSVSPRALMLFLKRLRFLLGVEKVRYFGVGEYGERTWRPHYHLTLFGCDRADFPELVERAWPFGFCKTTLAGAGSMAYVCQYTIKKMTKEGDSRLEGRHPEFTRMSRRPGLGAAAAKVLGEFYKGSHGRDKFFAEGDVNTEFRQDGLKWPLDRYIRLKMREEAGIGPDDLDLLLSAKLRLLKGSRVPLLSVEEMNARRRRSARAAASRVSTIRSKGVL